MPIEFGVFLPVGPEKGQVGTFMKALDAYAAPMAGHVDSLWMSDHLFWSDNPTLEAWTVISYLAAKYDQYRIGTMVLGQGYRNPALLAKMGATLQALSDGRLILGLGAGWKEDEYRAYGYMGPYPTARERATQLEEAIIIVKRMWYDDDPSSYYGRYYRIIDAYCQPKPDPVPPIMIGGSGRKVLRVAAQHANWWNATVKTPEEYADRLKILNENAHYVGRSLSEIRLTWMGKLAVAKTRQQAEKLVEHSGTATYLVGTPNEIVDKIAAFVELGVDYFIFEGYGLNNPKIVATIVEDLLPKIRALKSD